MVMVAECITTVPAGSRSPRVALGSWTIAWTILFNVINEVLVASDSRHVSICPARFELKARLKENPILQSF